MFLRLRWRTVLFFKELFKKFPKGGKVFLWKSFLYLDYPYTLDYEKNLFTILITNYTAYKGFLLSKLLPFLDYKNVLLATLSISQHSLLNLSCMANQTFSLWVRKENVSRTKNFSRTKKKPRRQRESLMAKENVSRCKKLSCSEREFLTKSQGKQKILARKKLKQ